MATRLTALFASLALAGILKAEPASSGRASVSDGSDVPTSPTPTVTVESDPHTSDVGTAAGQFWASAEYLHWWVRGDRLPPLVTTGPTNIPAGLSGVPGVPGTTVLFGGGRQDQDPRNGVRLGGGLWVDDCRTWGIGADVFWLQGQPDGFLAASTGFPPLARPVFNMLTGQPDAEITAFPGLATGSVAVTTESRLCGAGAFLRKAICCGECCSVDALVGYRYLNLDEQLVIAENLQAADVTPGAPPVGTAFALTDAYKTRTQFHGADFGLAAHLAQGNYFVDLIGKVAFGCNVREVTVGGSSQTAIPGVPTETFAGGLYTIGQPVRATDQVFAVVPELRLNVGCQVSDCVRVFVGYSVTGWTNVVRPGGQIDQRVNPEQLPPPLVPIPPRIIPFQDGALWLHGLNIGMAVAF
jgi:hypothetical protein